MNCRYCKSTMEPDPGGKRLICPACGHDELPPVQQMKEAAEGGRTRTLL